MIFKDELVSLLLVGFVVLSVVPLASGGPAVNSPQQSVASTDVQADSPEPSDEIYVRENGSAVLVYGTDGDTTGASEPDTDVEYGADISTNLFYFLASEPVEGETDVTGQASVLLTEANISGDGQFYFDRPDSLSSLSFEAAGQRTTENAASNLSLEMTLDDEARASGDELESVSTSGNVTVTGSRFTADSTFDAQIAPLAMGIEPGDASIVLTEDDGDYTVAVERNTTLSAYERDEYSTRERARETVESEFGGVASSFNGSADVTIDRYEFSEADNESAELDIAYTVEYTGVETELTETLAEELVESESVEMDRPRAEELTNRMRELSIERIAASYDADTESVSADVAVDVRNYDDIVVPAAEIANATDSEELDPETQSALDGVQTRLQAGQAAELRRHISWSAEISESSPGEATVTASADYTTENWDDYVAELDSRGIDMYNVSATASAATTEDDRVDVAGSLTVDNDVFTELTSQLVDTSAADGTEQSFLTSLLQADPERGKVNVSAEGERITMEVGAQFRNITVLRNALAEDGSVPAGVTSVVGREGTTYVTVEDAVAADATESDVRSLAYVDEETAVYMPGEWDREFPSMDTERAASFLGADLPANNTTATGTATGSSGPGFGATAALLALAGVTLLLTRRS
ncbi:PGF-CTERM sorting domain-containing protein [Haloarcula salinisoli]|uniref:PGF-CTERM sorting domain-containing protein n=1 Tax=Haloarcula salinisoli TaxID=2487746 RepID=A0A8J7YJE2_9EURY|nr:PGF-CTERM sorting domain-containing protein [Halomicroarcula salinisoli]MBX0304653.1 PGF-CTERM sorting domain-containing protein [Halomicroarcula salinisoli]